MDIFGPKNVTPYKVGSKSAFITCREVYNLQARPLKLGNQNVSLLDFFWLEKIDLSFDFWQSQRRLFWRKLQI